MPKLLLDTDIVIDLQHKFSAAVNWYKSIDRSDIAIAGFVALELIQQARNRSEATAAQNIIRLLPIAWPDSTTLETMLSQYESLSLAHGVGIIDLVIAGTAIASNAILYTSNMKHYRVIPGLNYIQPYTK